MGKLKEYLNSDLLDDAENVLTLPLVQSTAVDSNSAIESKIEVPVLNKVIEAEEEDDEVLMQPRSL